VPVPVPVPEFTRKPTRHPYSAAATAAAAGSASADSRGARHGHGFRTRLPVTGSVTDRAVAKHWEFRHTGLPSRSALVAPPLRLAALRWLAAFVLLGWSRPPPGVSTAFLVAVTRFSGRPFPGEPHTVLCPLELERWRHNTVYCTPAVARRLVLSGARDSRAPRCTRMGATVGRVQVRHFAGGVGFRSAKCPTWQSSGSA
jgi:hypothetical protein